MELKWAWSRECVKKLTRESLLSKKGRKVQSWECCWTAAFWLDWDGSDMLNVSVISVGSDAVMELDRVDVWVRWGVKDDMNIWSLLRRCIGLELVAEGRSRTGLPLFWNFWKPGNVREFCTCQEKGIKSGKGKVICVVRDMWLWQLRNMQVAKL